MPKKRSTCLPVWGQWVTGIALMAVAVAAGGVSLATNVSHGLETGVIAAAIYGLADVCKILVPVVAVAIGWGFHLRLTVIVCAAVSVWCIVQYNMDGFERLLNAATTTAERRNGEREDAARIRRDLAAISESMPAEALQRLVDDAHAEVEREANRCGAGKTAPCCFEKCEAAKRNESALTVRLLEAKRRDELTKKLAEMKEKAETPGKPAEVLGAAASMAAVSGGSMSGIARFQALLELLVKIVLIETLVYLSMPAARILGQAMKGKKQAAVSRAPAKKKIRTAPRRLTATKHQVLPVQSRLLS